MRPAPGAGIIAPPSPASRPSPLGGLRPALTPTAGGTRWHLPEAEREDQQIKIRLTEVSTVVSLNNARALKLDDWGWVLSVGGIEDPQQGVVTRLGEGFTHKPVNVRCSARSGALFAVSVERTGAGPGTVRSYTVAYDGGTVVVPFGIALCPTRCSQDDLHAAGD